MSNIEKTIKLAAKQHGLFATFQLKDSGIAHGSIHNLVHNKMFTRVSRGVYSIEGQANSWHRQALTRVFESGRNALLSHESALVNMELLNEDYCSIRRHTGVDFHVTLPRESRRRVSCSVHRSIYKVDLMTKTLINHIPQVPVEVAIIESARHMPEQFYSSVTDSAIRGKLTTPRKLRDTLDQLWPAPGRSKARIEGILQSYLHNSHDLSKTESALEARILRIVSQCTRSRIYSQFNVAINGRRYRIDIALPDQKIAIEVDGYKFHSGRESFDADKKRQNDLVSDGWTVLRFTATHSREEIRRNITHILSDGALKPAESSLKRPIA